MDLGKVLDPICKASAITTLLLTGFGGGFRRSELAALVVDHLEPATESIVVRVSPLLSVLPHARFSRTLKAWKYISRPTLKRSSSKWPLPMAKTSSNS